MEIDLQDTCLLVVDVQGKFCDPLNSSDRGNRKTATVAKKIASILPHFRAAAVPIYLIYTADRPLPVEEIGFYAITPTNDDVIFRKPVESAFATGNLKQRLLEKGIKKLFACGFNLNACVESTAVQGKKENFDVTLITDLVENGRKRIFAAEQPIWVDGWKKDMTFAKKENITIAKSSDLLKLLRKQPQKR